MSDTCLVSWSGGKDCCLALHALQAEGRVRIEGLFTTLGRESGRMAIHGVRRALLQQQAEALGLPLVIAEIPERASNADYEAALKTALAPIAPGAMAFGDLHLEDIRAYRDALFARLGPTPLYPLWGRPPRAVAADVIGRGFKAVVCAVDLEKLDASWLGRTVDAAFLTALPVGIDPCGENGEFHTFVHDGPNFARPVRFTPGEVVGDGRFAYRDLIPLAPADAVG